MELQKTDKKIETKLHKVRSGRRKREIETENVGRGRQNELQERKENEKTKEMDSESFNKMTHTDFVSLGGPRVEKREREKVWGEFGVTTVKRL